MPSVEALTTPELSRALLDAVRGLLVAAFGGTFSDEDWDHTLGGRHVLVVEEGEVVAHAAVVSRVLSVDAVAFRAGYVEGVATAPARQGQGFGTLAMETATDVVRAHHELGALSTGTPSFYERLGWERWEGETYVNVGADLLRTPDEDDGVMVLRHGPSAAIALTGAIACDARPGDDW